MKRYIFSVVFTTILSGFTLFGQSLDEARELYKIGEFKRALIVFEEEYNAKPTDPSLNQWYGVCLFETGGDLNKAEECISFAAKKGIQDAYLYLGRIYSKTYRYDLAASEFDRYAKLKRREKDALDRLEVDKKRLDMLQRASSRPEDIQIIDSIVVDKDKFLSAYKLSMSSGKLDYFNSFFSTDFRPQYATVYQNEKRSKLYYSKNQGKQNTLFSEEKLMEEYGNEKILSADNFGLSGNLNFPFVMSDGVTVYFAAEDNNNFGGYDIYVTRYNLNNDTYLAPERLNTPFNSPFNDYLYVVDEEKGVGWFASDRFQPVGKICVYTFIPNSSVEMVESDDNAYLISRARIQSIKKSWKTGVDYKNEISLAREDVIEEKIIQKDFEFVVNDKYTYYTLSDFKDQTAKDLYSQFLYKTKAYSELVDKLNGLRDSYHAEKSNAKAQEIMKLENQKPLLEQEIHELEIKVRNQEISRIK